jgi:hypothetical protein
MESFAIGAVCDLAYCDDVVSDAASVASFDIRGYHLACLNAASQSSDLFEMAELAMDDC